MNSRACRDPGNLPAAAMINLLAILGLGYAGVVALLYLAADLVDLSRATHLPSQRLDSPHRPERLELPAGDGATLHGMWFAGAHRGR